MNGDTKNAKIYVKLNPDTQTAGAQLGYLREDGSFFLHKVASIKVDDKTLRGSAIEAITALLDEVADGTEHIEIIGPHRVFFDRKMFRRRFASIAPHVEVLSTFERFGNFKDEHLRELDALADDAADRGETVVAVVEAIE